MEKKSSNSKSLQVDPVRRVAIKPDGTKISVKDSKHSFLVMPNKDDITKGIPGDHANCMYCLSCRRMYGSDLVWVARHVAYVEVRIRGGKSELHRFILEQPAKENIEKFDSGQEVEEEGVIFAAPRGCKTLDAIEKRNLLRKKAYITGTGSGGAKAKVKDGESRTRIPHASELRDPATGRFQFKFDR